MGTTAEASSTISPLTGKTGTPAVKTNNYTYSMALSNSGAGYAIGMSKAAHSEWSSLAKSLVDNDARSLFNQIHISTTLPVQIGLLREKKNLTQKQLAELAGTSQSAISRYEDVGYENFNLTTLLKLAKALDVALRVSFVPFSTLLDDETVFGDDAACPSSWDEDARVQGAFAETASPISLSQILARLEEELSTKSFFRETNPINVDSQLIPGVEWTNLLIQRNAKAHASY